MMQPLQRRSIVLALACSLAAAAGCSSDATPDDGAADTGTVQDTGGSMDTSPRPDVVAPDAADVLTPTDAPRDAPIGTDVVTPMDVPGDVRMGTDVVTPPDVPVSVDVPVLPDAASPMDAAMDAPTGTDVVGTDTVTGTDVVATDAPRDAVAPGCGNGVIEGSEQCDDGNTRNLDGCDSMCRYEVVTRLTALNIATGMAPASCTPRTNRFGTAAFTSVATDQLNTQLNTGVTDGSINVLMDVLGLTDLTGQTGSGLSLGVMSAAPDPVRGMWPMAGNPIDWWFLADRGAVNPMGLPASVVMPGTITTGTLNAGPSSTAVTVVLGGSPATLQMNSARIIASINRTPAPNTPAPPPGMLAAGTTVFQTLTASGAGQGLCGNVTVESLAQIPVPQSLATGGGTGACLGTCRNSHAYTYCGAGMPVGPGCNSLLDVIVGGCQVVACLVTVVNPTQPDVAASGAVRTLTLGTGNKVPASQVTGNTDAYSSYFTFNANRAHITGQACTATPECQTGQTCTSGFCR